MVIRWLTIAEASRLSGIDEDTLREAINKKKLSVAAFGAKGGKSMLTDIELNRFSLDLQYPKQTVNKAKARDMFTGNGYRNNQEVDKIINNILGEN
jgi:hypothetical protein